MKAQAAKPFADTNIIPDRNVGIGSLLWDLQNPQDLDRDGPSLLAPVFAFIDVGVSRAKVSVALKTLLVRELKMDATFVATELSEVVPYAHVTLLGDTAGKIHGCLSGMISSKGGNREIKDWHYVVDPRGKVSSVSYSYDLHGNEIWEAYFMGRTFMYSGENVEFSNPTLDEMLAPDVLNIEARIDLEMKRDNDPNQPQPSWAGFRIEKNPLETDLAEFGISLQKTDVPQRIADRQNVLYLGNVLNHYPQDEQNRELNKIVADMEGGDIVIVQMDEVATSSLEVFNIKAERGRKTLERMRRINTRTLEIQMPDQVPESGRRICVKPVLDRIVHHFIDSLEWVRSEHKTLAHQIFNHVFRTFFRALPVEVTLRIALREALRRLPPEGRPKGMPIFADAMKYPDGGALGVSLDTIVSEAELIRFGLSNPDAENPKRMVLAPKTVPSLQSQLLHEPR